MDYLKKNYDLAIILISHDLDYVAKYADKVILLDHATIAKQGTVKEVFQSPEFDHVFGMSSEEKWIREGEKMSQVTSWFEYNFMRNALIAVIIITPLFGLMGTMIVNKKMAFSQMHLGILH